MKLWVFFVFSITFWFLLRFLVGHCIKRNLLTGNSEEKLGAARLMPVVGLLGWGMFLSAVSSGGLLLAGWWLIQQGGSTLPEFEALLRRLTDVRDWLAQISAGWAILVAAVTFVGVCFFLSERSKGKLKAAQEKRLERELKELTEKVQRGEIEDLPPTFDMLRVENMIRSVEEAIREAHEKGATDEEKAYAEHRETLIHAHRAMDVRRRLNLELDEREIPLRKPETLSDKISFAFFSEGVASHASGGSLALIAILSLLMLPAWVSIQRGGLIEQLDTRIADVQTQREKEEFRLEQLAVAANQEQAKKDLDAVIQKKTEQPANEKEDDDEDSAINSIAAHAEFRYFQIRGIKVQNVTAHAAAKARSAASRDRILAAFASQDQNGVDHISPASPPPPGKPVSPENLFTEAVETEGTTRKPVSDFGKRIAANLRKAAKRNGDFLQNLKASYQKAATLEAIGEIFTSQLGASVVAHSAEANSKTWSTGIAAEADSVSAALVEGKPLDEALTAGANEETIQKFYTAADSATYRDRFNRATSGVMQANMADFAESQPPSLRVREWVDPVSSKVADTLLVRDVEFAGHGGNATDFVLSRQSYDSVFPGWLGSEIETAFGQAANLAEAAQSRNGGRRHAWYGPPDTPSGSAPSSADLPKSPGGPGGRAIAISHSGPGLPSSGGSRVKIATAANFSRSRSFTRLRGFSKVGGVLIGREPRTPASLEVTDLAWEDAPGGRVRLHVTFADGTKATSIPHDPDIVYQAIAYAADQRPTAVTMVAASPLLELKILLHPALLDSRLGWEISRLDQFVDTFAGKDFEPRVAAVKDVYSAAALYNLAWAVRILTVVTILENKPMLDAEDRSRLEACRALANSIGSRLPVEEILSSALPILCLSDEEINARVPLLKKSEFHDPDLVKMMRKAAKESSGDLAKFETIIQSDTTAEAAKFASNLNLPANNPAFQQPATFEIWSGVREREYELTPKALVMSSTNEACPLNFMLQVAFTSPPLAKKGAKADEADFDQAPWEFDGIKNALEFTVLERTREDDESREILRRASEFVYLQRFFRNAFEGRLGLDFPFAKVENLSASLQGRQPAPIRTSRWNARRGVLEFKLTKLIVEIPDHPVSSKLPLELNTWLEEAAPLAAEGLQIQLAVDRATQKLLEASDVPTRETNEWQKKWDDHWTETERKRTEWEVRWDLRLADLAKIRNTLEKADPSGWTQSLEGQLLVQLHRMSTGIAVRRQLKVQEDDKRQFAMLGAGWAKASVDRREEEAKPVFDTLARRPPPAPALAQPGE